LLRLQIVAAGSGWTIGRIGARICKRIARICKRIHDGDLAERYEDEADA